MKINLIIDTENESTSILYNGYNIIKTTIYDEETTKKLYEILKNAVNNEEFAGIETEQDFEKFLELKD